MKFFIGITPPPAIKERIFSFQKSFPTNKLPEILEPHITVKTKNGLTEDCSWLDTARSIIEDHPKFEVTFNGVGTFGDGVVVLLPHASKELTALHETLFCAIKPDESDRTKKYFEGDNFEAHFTLGMNSWGMTKEDLVVMKERGLIALAHLPGFEVFYPDISASEF